MFQLTKKEFETLRSQIATTSWGGARGLPSVFTEQGVAMLSSVLNSEKAIHVNIQIIRAFTKLREVLSLHKGLKKKIEEMEARLGEHDEQFQAVFEMIKQWLTAPEEPKRRIGFVLEADGERKKKPRKKKKVKS